MDSMNDTNLLVALSDAMTQAVEKASLFTLLVDARRRIPASGVAYTPRLIITADHVIEREEEIQILSADGSRFSANLAGRDPGSDLAVLEVQGGELHPAEPAQQAARVGQLALALGRPTQAGIQVSLGVVSALNGPVRTPRGGLLDSYLRTDATFYPGFSGGPLVDVGGRVLGINTSGLAHGLPLTIPCGLAWKIAEDLAAHGSVRRGYLGIRSQPVIITEAQRHSLGRPQTTGLLLVGVEEGGPADRGGLLVGDILVGVADQPISDPDELLIRLTGEMIGKSTTIQVLRGGQPLNLIVIIGERK